MSFAHLSQDADLREAKPPPEVSGSYLEAVRKLPGGTLSRTIEAAHDIASRRRGEAVGGGMRDAPLDVLFYDEETWKEAWEEVAVPELTR